jgi:hypothetical protein
VTRNLTRRLTAISAEVAGLRSELAVLVEQEAFQRDVMEEARVRALVAETPLADRELREAEDDLRRIERVRGEAGMRIEALRVEQDRLLAEMAGHPA